MKNVIFWVGVKNQTYSEKYGGWDWMDISRKTWEYWCKKHDVIFFPFEKPINDDLVNYRINWQKSIYCFDLLDEAGIDYDQIFLVDASCMARWDMPNVFELTDHKFTAWRETDNLNWVYNSVKGYEDFFCYDLDIQKYFSSGVIIFNKSHKDIFLEFKDLYLNNTKEFVELQDKVVRKGTEQTPLNYWVQKNDVELNLDLPFVYKLTHIHRKEMFGYNWQLEEDRTPYFIKYGYNWVFNGIPKNERTKIMRGVWNLVKHNYVDQPDIDFLLKSINEDKSINPTTTSDKFKTDVWNFFKDFKDQICVEFGTHKGQTTKVLSHCFKKVFTINVNEESLATAKMLNVGIDNIEYVPFDLYSNKSLILKDISVALIDAGHKYEQVLSDIKRCLEIECDDDFYIVFDDYGLNVHEHDVKRAVDESIKNGNIELVKKIGCEPGHTFNTNRVLKDYEGLICRVVK
tara:strand:+ start:641 stop:2014 length:1374 start_codon:yes stop_codon:yes gene_type:complete